MLLQLLNLHLEVLQSCRARVPEHCILRGQCEVLEQAAQVAAAAEDLVAHIPLLGLLAQRVHQLLSHHDDQLALCDEDLWGRAAAEAAVKYADGFEERPKIEPAMFRKVDFLLRILLVQRWGDKGARILQNGKKTIDKRDSINRLWWFPFSCFCSIC